MTDSLLTSGERIRFDGGMELHIPDGTFSMSDLEKANAQMSATDVKFLFAGAIVDGRVEVLGTPDPGIPFVYRKTEKSK